MGYNEWRLVAFLVGIFLFTAMGILFPRRVQQKTMSSRFLHNIAFGASNPLLIKLLLSITLLSWTEKVQIWQWGFFNQWEGPLWLEAFLVFIIFDGIIYWQHRITHTLPLLWRFHRVHHSDVEFDSSTAIRFHFLEIILSFGIKMMMIAVFGGPILGVFLFEVVLNFSAMFNHSNWSLPVGIDKWMRKVVATPDFHRVHHSIYRKETDSNYGFCLTLWDYIFGTYISQPQDGHAHMKLGIGIFNSPQEQNYLKMWTQPFRKG